MAVSATTLNQLYLAYFGRPGDIGGINFYQTQPDANVASVAAAFSASPESTRLYGPTFGEAQIDSIYRTLFNRSAEPAGVQYWSAEVNSGRLSPAGAAYGILVGAQNDDLVTVNNKLQVNAAFTDAINTETEIMRYTGDAPAASARMFIASVTSANLSTSLAGVDAAVIAATSNSSFTLTTSADSFVGTSANDSFNAATGTLQSSDYVDGGAGADLLTINDTTTAANGYFSLPAGMTVVNVEALNVITSGAVASSAAGVADFSGLVGLTSLNVVATGTASTRIQAAAATEVALTVTGQAGASVNGSNMVRITSSDAGPLNVSTQTNGQDLQLLADTANVTVTAGTANTGVGIRGSVKTMTVAINNGASDSGQTEPVATASVFSGANRELTTLTLTGNGTAQVFGGDSLTSVNASGLGGPLIGGERAGAINGGLFFTGDAAAKETVTLGIGYDSIAVSSTVAQMDVVNNFDAVKETATANSTTDVIVFGGLSLDGATANQVTELTLSSGATTLALALAEAAAAQDSATQGIVTFAFGANTYIFKEAGVANNTVNDNDLLVQITGSIDFTMAWGVATTV